MRFKGRQKLISSIILITVIGSLLSISFFNKKIDMEVLDKNLEMITQECNEVYKDMENVEEKYKKLLDEEDDILTKGRYASVLLQYYAIISDYENIMKYAYEAEKYYEQLPGGEYYILADKKYVAWVMLRLGNYSESFKVTSELLDVLNSSKDEILTKEQILDTEALIYAIFLYIYSHFEIMDNAKVYYDKLNTLEMTEELERAKGDKIASSKMLYVEKLGDLKLMKKYATECYEVSLKRDKKFNGDTADSVIGNVGYANIKLGNYQDGVAQLKKSEEFHKKIDDEYGMVFTYAVYAEYYTLINDIDKANEYYKKTLKLYNDSKNYLGLKDTIKDYIEFLNKNEIKEDINIYYEAYYQIKEKVGIDQPTNDFLAQVISINDELNKSTVLLLKDSAKEKEKSVVIAIVVIIVLAILLIRMRKLIEIKNESEKKLERAANIDYLTQVNTRAYGESLILKERYKNKKITMAIVDIDKFKSINDTYGHTFGDVILKEVARHIQEGIEKEDILTRYGGEEFTIAFVDKDKEEAKETLDRIRESLNEIIFENDVRVSFSGGIKEWESFTLKDVIHAADELLYKAKNEGRNRIIA